VRVLLVEDDLGNAVVPAGAFAGHEVPPTATA
jgi:hypothetical protein